jgi:hypothetical protein
MHVIKPVFSLCIRDIENVLSCQTISIAAGSILKTHRVWMSTTLNDAVCHPRLQFVVEGVPHPAASDFISTEAAHGLSILCNRSRCNGDNPVE